MREKIDIILLVHVLTAVCVTLVSYPRGNLSQFLLVGVRVFRVDCFQRTLVPLVRVLLFLLCVQTCLILSNRQQQTGLICCLLFMHRVCLFWWFGILIQSDQINKDLCMYIHIHTTICDLRRFSTHTHTPGTKTWPPHLTRRGRSGAHTACLLCNQSANSLERVGSCALRISAVCDLCSWVPISLLL